MIQLSVLIITTESRAEMSMELYRNLLAMIGDREIELVMIFDNRKRTIGAKREAAKSLVQGKFFLFCDSDDEFVSLDEIYEATFLDVDVIDFKAQCTNPDGSSFIITQQLGNEVEHNTKDGKYLDCKRPPFPNCAWNTHKVLGCSFPDISYGEDWAFVQECLSVVRTEHFIDKVLFKYNFDPKITEASTEDNPYWTNPNHKKVISRCIVNVSTDKYRKGQKRLATSLRNNTNATVLLFESEEEVGAAPHAEMNYSFKPMAMIKAYEAGYRQILWLDASMRAIKNIDVIFEIIERDGYFFQDSGWLNSRWTHAEALAYFGTDEGPMLSSGVLGLDLDSEIGYKFFDQWTQAMRDGMFNGSWDIYRHDQSAASLIAYKMGLKLQPGNTFFVYGKDDEPTITEQTVLLADGIS
jgi:hypothetical protein